MGAVVINIDINKENVDERIENSIKDTDGFQIVPILKNGTTVGFKLIVYYKY